MTRQTKRERTERAIEITRSQVTLKEAYLPTLEASPLSESMKQAYRDGIAQEKNRIAKLQEGMK